MGIRLIALAGILLGTGCAGTGLAAPSDVSDGTTAHPISMGGLERSYRVYKPSGLLVELITVDGAGHQWPGGVPARRRGDAPSPELNATAAFWEFFAAHPG